ncbi:hypothetical protein [Streptomyces griseoruber]|uniref:Uncharacterized protein n=1 Tax=Streptomyces griseoruber TaxID=1943 RepID=A0A101T4R1_9ACTN|nr:hypothetical protein [Streptomyces griseoruber]KUN85720.1 hypothetical protein AQJ64_11445 [Streptomyces griseoruber]
MRLLRTAGCGDAKIDKWSLGSTLRLVALGAEEGEREVDAFDLTKPVLVLGAPEAGKKVGFEFFESVEHLRVDVEHRTADAGVFVLAGGAVRASTGAEFDLAAVEVLLELSPFLIRRVAVLTLGPNLAAVVQVLLVVADDILVEDR